MWSTRNQNSHTNCRVCNPQIGEERIWSAPNKRVFAGLLGGTLLGAHSMEPSLRAVLCKVLLNTIKCTYSSLKTSLLSFFILSCTYLWNTEKHKKVKKKTNQNKNIIPAHSQEEAHSEGFSGEHSLSFSHSLQHYEERIDILTCHSGRGPTDISTVGAPEQQPALSSILPRPVWGPVNSGCLRGGLLAPGPWPLWFGAHLPKVDRCEGGGLHLPQSRL